MLLYIVRHAWAKERDALKFPDDAPRPLTKQGRVRFGKVVEKLAERGVLPEVIATSPYVRCRRTAEILAEHVAGRPQVVDLQALTPDSDLEALIAWTRQQEKATVAWVGHAPDVSELTARLIGGEGSAIRFAKGAVAALEFAGEITVGQGELQWLLTAKMLGR